MKKFKEFLDNGIVRVQSPNKNRAISLLTEVKNKKDYLYLSLKSIPRNKWNANFIINYCYDILIELVRAKMFLDGFNSGSSHEAVVSYLRVIAIPEPDVIFMDELRYFRNGTKYYGTILGIDYAIKVLDFMEKHYSSLVKLIE